MEFIQFKLTWKNMENQWQHLHTELSSESFVAVTQEWQWWVFEVLVCLVVEGMQCSKQKEIVWDSMFACKQATWDAWHSKQSALWQYILWNAKLKLVLPRKSSLFWDHHQDHSSHSHFKCCGCKSPNQVTLATAPKHCTQYNKNSAGSAMGITSSLQQEWTAGCGVGKANLLLLLTCKVMPASHERFFCWRNVCMLMDALCCSKLLVVWNEKTCAFTIFYQAWLGPGFQHPCDMRGPRPTKQKRAGLLGQNFW